MKKSFWIALPLAALLTLPVLAQQSSSSSANQDQQPAASSQQAQTSGDQNLSAHQPLQAETHEGFWGKINPFARKKYVQRQLSPVRDRVNELDDLTAQNAKNIQDVDSRAQAGIRDANSRAAAADQKAMDAGNRAQQANQTAQAANTRLQTVEQVVTNFDQYKPVTEAEIRFRPGQTTLSDKAKEALDQIAQPLKDQKGYIVQVQGFAAGRGQTAIENSRKMADAVVRYLVINHEVPVYRVRVLGLGNIPAPAAQGDQAQQGTEANAKAPRRRSGGSVEVSLLKNDLEQLNNSNKSELATPAATVASK